MTLGEKITILRKARGFSQEQLGLSLASKDNGVSRQTVSDWENGRTEPKLDNIRALADLLNVSFDALLDEKLDLNNPECLSAVLGGGPVQTKEVLAGSSTFLYKRSYGLVFIALLALFVGVGLALMIPAFKEAENYFAQSAAKNGDATVMGQTLRNRAITYQSIGILGASILALGVPVSIVLWVRALLKKRPCGYLNNKELVLYPHLGKGVKRFALDEVNDIKKGRFLGLDVIASEKVHLSNVARRSEIIKTFTSYKG